MTVIELSQVLGNFGEFFGAIAVVVTLVYLAVQIRQNSRHLQQVAYQSRADATVSVSLALAQSDSLADIISRANRGDALCDEEQLRCARLVSSTFRNFENTHFQHQLGLLTDEHYEATEAALRDILVMRPAYRQHWSVQKPGFRKSYVEWVDKLIAETTE